MWFVETNSAESYGVAVNIKFMSLLCQNIFRYAMAGFVRLCSPLTQMLRKARDEFLVRVIREPTLNIFNRLIKNAFVLLLSTL
jgi:hypothetical protein